MGDLSSLNKLDVFEFLVNLRSHKRTKRPTQHIRNSNGLAGLDPSVHLNIYQGLGVGSQEVRQVGVERVEVWERTRQSQQGRYALAAGILSPGCHELVAYG